MSRFMAMAWMGACVLMLACDGGGAPGGGDGGSDVPDGGQVIADATPANESYLPLAVGASWTYKVTRVGQAPVEKTSSVEALEDVGGMKAGTMAFRVKTAKIDGITMSWQHEVGGEVVREREQDFDLQMAMQADTTYMPHKLRIDMTAAHVMASASWLDAYQEIMVDPNTQQQTTANKSEQWTVVAVEESVTVPAGTFTALHLHRVGQTQGQADKHYWFARGVGKVKEAGGGGDTEELTAYTIP